MQSALSVLQEGCDWLRSKCLGELEACNLHTPTAIRRMLYRAVRMRLLREASDATEPGLELLELLPFLLLERVKIGATPDIMRGIDERQVDAGEYEMPASSSDIDSIGPAPPPPADHARPKRRPRHDRDDSESVATGPRARGSRSPAPSPNRELRVAPSSGLLLQMRLDALSESIVEDAVRCALAFVLKQTPMTMEPAHLQLQRGGTFHWNTLEGRPSHPACRVHGAHPVIRMQGSNQESLRRWQQHGGAFCLHDRDAGAQVFSDTIHHWMAGRPHLHSRVRWLVQAEPAWAKLVFPGSWFYANVDDTSIDESRLEGFHGTTMHVLERIMAQGMETGWTGVIQRKIRRLGVYFHILARAHLCHNYMLYSALDDTGFLISPVIHLSAPVVDPQKRLVSIKTSGQPQNLTYQDVCRVHGIWFHVIHVLQLWSAAAAHWIWAEPKFAREVEVDPLLERAELESLARARAQRPS